MTKITEIMEKINKTTLGKKALDKGKEAKTSIVEVKKEKDINEKEEGINDMSEFWKKYIKSNLSCTKPECSHKELTINKGILSGGKDKEQQKKADLLILTERSDMRDYFLIIDSEKELSEYNIFPKDKRIIIYPIVDGDIPDEDNGFLKMLSIMHEYLIEGKRVHVHCIGGHGRTGTVIACYMGIHMGIKTPIAWVRENYCERAIETKKQIAFINYLTHNKEEAKPRELITSIHYTYGGWSE